MSRCQEICIQGILDPINLFLFIHIPFLTLKNNKQCLNQNQMKTITNSVNETSTHFCFWLHSHTISYPNKQSQQQKRQNKVQKTVRVYNKDTRATSSTSIKCLYRQPRTSHLTLSQRPDRRLHSSNWLMDKNLLKVY